MEVTTKYAAIINKICSSTRPGKKVLQKMFYLMERQGVNLSLQYTIHYFGPYSTKLDDALHTLESNDVINIDTSGNSHIISMGEEKVTSEVLDQKELEKVQFVLDTFIDKTALELEAITTLDYVAKHLVTQSSDTQVIECVKKIKGNKFSEDVLQSNLSLLKEYGYL